VLGLSIDTCIECTMHASMDMHRRLWEASGMWHSRLKEKVGSNRKAAARLFPEWKRKARKEVDREKTTEQALANKIGMLHSKGDVTGWWSDRPVLRQLLADLVELEADEIFGAPSRTVGASFLEFPALPPLKRDEAPCRTSRAGSVFDLACAAIGNTDRMRQWIVVPPGGGKSLTIELLLARFPGEITVQTVSRLVEAAALTRKDAGSPIVVEVEEPDPANDLASLGTLEAHQAPVVVLAPFNHPDHRIREWQAPGRAPSGWNGTWATSHGTPDTGWIARMLDWIDGRLTSSARDTKLDKDDVLAWLEANPSVLRSIQSPGDLLALCADFDLYGSEGTPQERAERWFRSIGVKSLPDDGPRTWMKYAASDCVITMAEVNALDRTTALHERSFARWSELVPPSVPPSENVPGADLVVGYLRAAGLLRSDEHGVGIYPKWAAAAVAQRRMGQLVTERQVATWGAVAGDASRQQLVDDALDAVIPGDLRAAGETLLAGMKTGGITFAEVAALEALVAALGRRLATGAHDPKDADLAKRALVVQLDHLISGPSIGPHRVPTTHRDLEQWFLTGWAISLATPGTKVDVPTDLRWILPGWTSKLLLSDAERHCFPWSSVQPWGATDTVRALARLTPMVVQRMTPTTVPKDVPRLLLPALILADNWTLTHQHLTSLSGTWEETLLANAVKSLDGERSQSLASLFWQFASEACGASNAAPVAERLVYLKNRQAPLFRFVMENIPVTVVEETARTAGTHRRPTSGNAYTPSDPGALRHLDSDRRAAAVRARLSGPVRFDEVRELVEVLDGDDLDVLLDVVRAADRDVAAEFATRVWHVLPARAEAESRRAFADGLAAAEAWFRTAPRARLGALLEVVGTSSDRPPWVLEWALAKLLDGGVHAESLFRLTQAEPPATPAASWSRRRAKRRPG